MNVTIEGNTIVRIKNGRCIDLRKCFSIVRNSESKVSTPNTGNVIRDNEYDGEVRLYVRKHDPTSFLGNNRKICE